jgi:hypothetical protein
MKGSASAHQAQNAEQMDQYSLLLQNILAMDRTIVERLRATVGVSLTWAEQMLDICSRLEAEAQSLEATQLAQYAALTVDDGSEKAVTADSGRPAEAMMQRSVQSVVQLRSDLREMSMTMLCQDVIGQAIERAAAALAQRADAITCGANASESSGLPVLEIGAIHRAYIAQDDLHCAQPGVGADVADGMNGNTD